MKFGDWTISRKLLVTPAIFTVALIGLAVLAFVGLGEIRASSAFLFKDSASRIADGLALKNRVGDINGGLFRMLSWSNSGVEEEKISALAKKLLVKVEELTPAYAAIKDRYAFSNEERTKVEELAGLIERYVTASKDVIDMIEIDTATSVIMMVETDQAYEALYAQVDAVVNDWFAHGETTFEAADQSATNIIKIFLAITAVAIIVAFAISYFISNAISRPIDGLNAVMLKLADGDTSVDVPGAERKDEVGAMARAVGVFKDNRIEAERLEAEQRKQHAQTQARATMVEELARHFDRDAGTVLGEVTGAAETMDSTARALLEKANRTTQQAATVASAAEEASTNVQTVASAAEELSSSISEIARQVSTSSEIANQAVDEAERTNTKVQGLSEASQQIGEVLSLINEIAEQTNLLALNATIEAARAGDAGKGFAVVASEVKNLATQTAKATNQIAEQISGIQGATADAADAIAGIAKTIGEIDSIISGIAAAVEQQGAATSEIARNAEQAAVGTGIVSQNIGGVSSTVGDTERASTEMCDVAAVLKKQANSMAGFVGKFLADLKAA